MRLELPPLTRRLARARALPPLPCTHSMLLLLQARPRLRLATLEQGMLLLLCFFRDLSRVFISA